MRNVDHTGNTCIVGSTCFTAAGVTKDELAVLREFGVSGDQFGTYFNVHITDWPAVYTHLNIIGQRVPFIPDYALSHTGKLQEWVRAGFLEQVQEAYRLFISVDHNIREYRAVTHGY